MCFLGGGPELGPGVAGLFWPLNGLEEGSGVLEGALGGAFGGADTFFSSLRRWNCRWSMLMTWSTRSLNFSSSPTSANASLMVDSNPL